MLIDSDAIVRELQQPGSPVLAALAERFGDEIITPDGALDRQALADKVFPDPEAVKALNKIVHPAVGIETAPACHGPRRTDAVVVVDIPLLEEEPRDNLQATIVVDVPVDVQVERLVRFRGFTEADARARIDRQAPRQRRLELADFVIDNSGAPGDLAPQVESCGRGCSRCPTCRATSTSRRKSGSGASVRRAKISSSTTSPVGTNPLRR